MPSIRWLSAPPAARIQTRPVADMPVCAQCQRPVVGDAITRARSLSIVPLTEPASEPLSSRPRRCRMSAVSVAVAVNSPCAAVVPRHRVETGRLACYSRLLPCRAMDSGYRRIEMHAAAEEHLLRRTGTRRQLPGFLRCVRSTIRNACGRRPASIICGLFFRSGVEGPAGACRANSLGRRTEGAGGCDGRPCNRRPSQAYVPEAPWKVPLKLVAFLANSVGVLVFVLSALHPVPSAAGTSQYRAVPALAAAARSAAVAKVTTPCVSAVGGSS